MKVFVALGQGWSNAVRLERKCFARLFASIGVGTFTTAQNPVFLEQNDIPVVRSLKGVTDIFLYAAQIDAIGGVLNRIVVSDELELSRFEGRIWHLAVDTRIPAQSLYKWALYKKRRVPGAQPWVGEMHCISQARNTEALIKGYEPDFRKFGMRPTSVRHLPLELNRAFADACVTDHEPERPLVYIGGDRQGKRTKVLGNFLTPVKDQCLIVGNVTRVFKESYPHLSVRDSVRSEGLWDAYQLGEMALALGDKGYEELKHFTPRLYEASIAGRCTVIHESFINSTEKEFPTDVWPRVRTAQEALSIRNHRELREGQLAQLMDRHEELVQGLASI